MDDLILQDTTGKPLNARIEVSDLGLVIHSRSGKDRNRDYRQAVELVLARLDATNLPYEVYLDSLPLQSVPLLERRLHVDHTGNAAERFNELVRAMNNGSASNGAWRRLLLAIPNYTGAALASMVAGARGAQGSHGRLPMSELRQVTHQHIDNAVVQLLSGKDALNFGPSRDFDVLAPDGTRLAPKKVYGLALTAALSIEAGPEHFTAGLGTPCFRALEAAGYPVVRKGEAVPGNDMQPVDPDLAAAEGDQKLVTHLRRERRPALAAAKRRAMLDQLGHLQCERCKLVPSQALGPHGDAVIEVHHANTYVADMAADHVTRLTDLICLCANCHRIVHREYMA